ncbi:MAG: DUF748 domain-containing protein [Candidatus Omnitrophica bacterium]|nr:DUF748 domain-containing protein [Candidatus Omnitrophota bacterium]
MKRVFITVLILLVIAAAAIFIYRFQILRYSAETLIRRALPDYVRIDKIDFDAKNGRLVLTDFKILNPHGFSNRYLLEIEEIICRYRLKGKNLLEGGLEILEPSFKNATLNIERLTDGKINLGEMKGELESSVKKAEKKEAEKSVLNKSKAQAISSRIVGDKTLPDILTLPERFSLTGGKLIFIDRLPHRKPHMITLENVDANISIKLNPSYSMILNFACAGQGNLNGNHDEVVRWNVSMNPTTPKLTMSNRIEVSNLDILPFEPYYDEQSPFAFKKGRFSGSLVFDFDNGNIGSTNEIHLSDYIFYIKRGYENAEFWQTNVEDLARYFTSSSGEIIFDFKIKGDMANPKFYLGPISKQAIAGMAVDKISTAIIERARGTQPGATAAPKTDLEKAQEYIDLFKGLIKKK